MLITQGNLIFCFCRCQGNVPATRPKSCACFSFLFISQLPSETLCLIAPESDSISCWSFMVPIMWWGPSWCGSRSLLAFLVTVFPVLMEAKLDYLDGWNLGTIELRPPVSSEAGILTSFVFRNGIGFWRLSAICNMSGIHFAGNHVTVDDGNTKASGCALYRHSHVPQPGLQETFRDKSSILYLWLTGHWQHQ